MIHEAYMPLYIGSRFSLRTGARAGPPEVVQEALADLKKVTKYQSKYSGELGSAETDESFLH